jgi:hypothetical protein
MCHPGSYIPVSKCSFPSGECGNLGLAELLCLGWMFTALLSLCYGPFSSWSPHQIPKSLTAVSQDLTATTPEIKKTVWDWQLPYQREDFLIQGYKSPVTNGMNGCQFFQSESSSLSLPRMKQRVAAESNCAVRGTEWQVRLLLCDILTCKCMTAGIPEEKSAKTCPQGQNATLSLTGKSIWTILPWFSDQLIMIRGMVLKSAIYIHFH